MLSHTSYVLFHKLCLLLWLKLVRLVTSCFKWFFFFLMTYITHSQSLLSSGVTAPSDFLSFSLSISANLEFMYCKVLVLPAGGHGKLCLHTAADVFVMHI